MEEIKSEKQTDINIEYDILNEAIETFKKTLTETTISPRNNIIKNSVFNKLRFFDLVLIDNNSNFLDLKIKLEINSNKNSKNQIFNKDNVIYFSNFSDLTINILNKINKDSNAYTISYFRDNLEKITSNLDFNKYQGKAVFVKVSEKPNKRNINISLSNSNLSLLQIKNIANRNNSINNNNFSKEKILINKEFKEFNIIERDISPQASETINTVNNFKENIMQKQQNKQNYLNLNNIIEENLKFNFHLKNKRNSILLPNSNIDLSDNKSSNNCNYINNELITLDKLNVNDCWNAEKEETHLLEINKKNFLSKNKNDKSNFPIDKRISKKNIQEISVKIENNSKNKLRKIKHQKDNSIILPNVYKKFLKKETNENQEFHKNYENFIFPDDEKKDSNPINCNFSERNKKTSRNSFFSRKFDSKNKNENEKKPVSLIKLKKKSIKYKENLLKISKANSNEAEPKENKGNNLIDNTNDNNLTNPYLITNESYSDNHIKPKIPMNPVKIQSENLSYLTSNDLNSFRNISNIINNSNFTKLKVKNLTIYKSPTSEENKEFEKEFFAKKIKINNKEDPQINNVKNIVMNNTTLNFELAKGKKKIFNQDRNKISSNFFKTQNAYNASKNTLLDYKSNSNSKNNWGISKEKILDCSRYNTSNNFYVANNSNEFSKQNPISPKNSYLINFSNNENNKNNPFFAKGNYSINNNSDIFSNEKYSIFSKTFNNYHKNKHNRNRSIPNNPKASVNPTNNESYIPSLINNKSSKFLFNYVTNNATDCETETDLKFLKFQKKKISESKLKELKELLGIEEKTLDLDKTFNRFLENIENNEANNFYYLNLFNHNCNNHNSQNNQFFENPTMNNKVHSVETNNNNENNYQTGLLKEISFLQRKNEIFKEKLSKNFNKSASKFQDLYCRTSKDKFNRYKYFPNLDKTTYEEIKATKAIINQFIGNHLEDLLQNYFSNDKLIKIIFINNSKEKENKELIDLRNIEPKKSKNINSLTNDYHRPKESLLAEDINNLNNRNLSITNKSLEDPKQPQQRDLNEEDYKTAKKFIFYCYLNSIALKKFLKKKLNLEEEKTNKNQKTDYTNSETILSFSNLNLNVPLENNVSGNINNWLNSANQNLALEFFNISNNSKTIFQFNIFVKEAIEKLKKDPSNLIDFINSVSQNNFDLHNNSFAIDLIFYNIYLINTKDHQINEKLVYMLVEFLANEKDKKIYFENFKRLKSLPVREKDDKENADDKFSVKLLFLKDFLKMLINNSDNFIGLVMKSFEIKEDEIYFILLSSSKELKKFFDNENLKKKIDNIFNELMKSLL